MSSGQKNQLVVNIGLVLILAGIVVSSFSYSFEARFMPLLVGIPTLALAVLQLFLDLRPDSKKKKRIDIWGTDAIKKTAAEETDQAKPAASEGEAKPKKDPRVFEKKEYMAALWMLLLAAMLFLLGYVIALPLFVAVFLIAMEENWKIVVGVTGLIALVEYVGFMYLLEVRFYEGYLLGMF